MNSPVASPRAQLLYEEHKEEVKKLFKVSDYYTKYGYNCDFTQDPSTLTFANKGPSRGISKSIFTKTYY